MASSNYAVSEIEKLDISSVFSYVKRGDHYTTKEPLTGIVSVPRKKQRGVRNPFRMQSWELPKNHEVWNDEPSLPFS